MPQFVKGLRFMFKSGQMINMHMPEDMIHDIITGWLTGHYERELKKIIGTNKPNSPTGHRWAINLDELTMIDEVNILVPQEVQQMPNPGYQQANTLSVQ